MNRKGDKQMPSFLTTTQPQDSSFDLDRDEALKDIKQSFKDERKHQYTELQAHFCAVSWESVICYWCDEELKYWWNYADALEETLAVQKLEEQLKGKKIPVVLGQGEGSGWNEMMSARIKLFGPDNRTAEEILEFIDAIVSYQFARAVAYISVTKPLTNDMDLRCPFRRHTFLPIKMMRALIFHMARGRTPKPLLPTKQAKP